MQIAPPTYYEIALGSTILNPQNLAIYFFLYEKPSVTMLTRLVSIAYVQEMANRLRGIRGAVFCRNEQEDISRYIIELYDNIIQSNNLVEDDVVSIIFSVTNDITALNPAAALRKSGRAKQTALFCLTEAPMDNGYPNVIRVLLHCYISKLPVNVYLNGAEILRPDLPVNSDEKPNGHDVAN